MKWKCTIRFSYSYGRLHKESVEFGICITVCSGCSAIFWLSLVGKYVEIKELLIFFNSSFVDMECIVWILFFTGIGEFASVVLSSTVYTDFFFELAVRSFFLLLVLQRNIFAVRSQLINSWALHFWHLTIGWANHCDWSFGKSTTWL